MVYRNVELKDIRGKSLNITLFDACIGALCATMPNDIDGQNKYQRYLLAERIQKNVNEVDLSEKEVSFIKNYIGMFYMVEYVGAVFKQFENRGEGETNALS
jgi:hypothetical protein